MVVAARTDEVREVVRLIADDEYVHGLEEDVDNHSRTWRKCLRMRQPAPTIRTDDTWDQYMYFLYVGEGVRSSSGFRYTDGSWIPHMVSTATNTRVEALLARIRDAGNPAVDDQWNAAAITYERVSDTGNLHLFYGIEAENWYMTPSNQERIAEQGLALFGRTQER